MSANNSLLYYKTYYEKVDWKQSKESEKNQRVFEEENKKLFGNCYDEQKVFHYPETYTDIPLQTTYPGLLLGSGITHGSGLQGELKLGFFFDYTTGLPVIPGSAVKGVLRSVFPMGFERAAEKQDIGKDKKELLLKKAEQRRGYIKKLISEITKKDWPLESVNALEEFLFGNNKTGEKNKVPMSGRTIFHDAILRDTKRVRLNGEHTLTYLADDYITPHKNPKKDKNKIPDELVNPTPISFLKVLPGVVFKFQFELKSFEVEFDKDKFKATVSDIKELFKIILTTIGVGAKTNVGYGQLETPGTEPNPSELEKARKSGKKKRTNRQEEKNVGGKTGNPEYGGKKPPEDEGKPPLYTRFPRKGAEVKLYGIIKASNKTDKDGNPIGPNRINFLTEKPGQIKGYKDPLLNKFEPGTYVAVTIKLISDKDNEVDSITSIEKY